MEPCQRGIEPPILVHLVLAMCRAPVGGIEQKCGRNITRELFQTVLLFFGLVWFGFLGSLLLCNYGWSSTYRDPPVSVSLVLELKLYFTAPDLQTNKLS